MRRIFTLIVVLILVMMNVCRGAPKIPAGDKSQIVLEVIDFTKYWRQNERKAEMGVGGPPPRKCSSIVENKAWKLRAPSFKVQKKHIGDPNLGSA